MMQSLIKYFVKEKKKDDEEVNEKDLPQDLEEKEFKSFSETYKIITFALSFGLMYPNPNTRWFRFIGISIMLATATPLAVFILADIYKCWLRKDIFEIIRHSTIVGPFLGGFLKQYFMVIFQDPANAIINEINRDYELYNNLDEDYRSIVRAHVNNCLVNSEKWWMVNVLTCVMIFPIMAATFTLYSFLFDEVPQKYMVHELNKAWDKDPEARFESPYYELLNIYMLYCCSFYVLNFLGYDGFYGLAINHAVLKMEMYCKALQDAMAYDATQVYARVVGVICEQNRTFRYMDEIQNCFNLWLGIIFLATMIQLCNLLYHITAGNALDVRYFIFITGVTIHIYLPCHYSAKLKFASAAVPTRFYACGWESAVDRRIRTLLQLMIARAQETRAITAMGMMTFDMELFVQILQTSYSMYTLLSS